MATKLYFHMAANAITGTFPSAPQTTSGGVTISASWQLDTAGVLRTMSVTKGSSQSIGTGTSLASTALQSGYMGAFAAPPFDVGQTVGAPTQQLSLNIGNAESDLNMNIGSDLRAFVYVWRPSAGALVGVVLNYLNLAGDAEPLLAATAVSNNAMTMTTTGIAAQAGDVLICEIWQRHTQTLGMPYVGGFYIDGATENAITNRPIVDHAAYLNFASDTLTFRAAPPVPAPRLPSSDSGGSGAGRERSRKKFVVPDLSIEPTRTLDDILGTAEGPAPVTVVEPLEPVKPNPLAEALAASPPDVQQALTLPKPSPVVVKGEEYSDEDLMYLLLMVTP